MKKLFFLVTFLLFTFCFLNKPAILNTSSTKKEKPTIVIDVGHGGIDPGKVGPQGILEKDLNLEIAHYLKKEFKNEQFEVYLSRENDCGLYDENVSNKKRSDLNNRIQFFQKKNADFVISIHQNSYPTPEPFGAQTFYYANSALGKQLAESIQASLIKMNPLNHRSAKPSTQYYILKKSSPTTIIIECGFLSNSNDCALLTQVSYQKKLAKYIFEGFLTFHKKRAAFY